LLVLVGVEGHSENEEVGEEPERVHLGLLGVLFVARLRVSVVKAESARLHLVGLDGLLVLGGAEVGQLGHVVLEQQHVVGLDVPVQQVHRVHLLQSRADREAVDHSLSRRHNRPAQLAEDLKTAIFAIGIPPLVFFLRLLPEFLIVRLEVTIRRSLN